MPVDNLHPDFVDRADEWKMLRDSERGPTAVDLAGEAYLPMPSGFRVQPDAGLGMYGSYKLRAQFPDILGPTLRGMVGIIHRMEANIELPKALLPLWEKATRDGLPLEAFHRRVTGELLLMGRYGIMVDAPGEDAPDANGMPYFAGYNAEALINWTDLRDFFVLNESGIRREDEFDWLDFKRHRVLRLDKSGYSVQVYDDLKPGKTVRPVRRGGAEAVEIPFVVMGARDLAVAPDEAPLIGVARSSLALYRLDADYRHQLYMSGQETFVVINSDPPAAVGAGVVVVLTGDNGPDAKYVGPSGTGIAAHRTAIQDERDAAIAAGARLFDNAPRGAESGEALRLRYGAQTATLTSVAQASAAGLEKALKHAAIMVGANPDEVVVAPNLKFIETVMPPQDALNLVKVWQSGAISKETLYNNLQRGEIATVERSFEDEEKLIAAETPAVDPAAAAAAYDGLPPVDDDEEGEDDEGSDQ